MISNHKHLRSEALISLLSMHQLGARWSRPGRTRCRLDLGLLRESLIFPGPIGSSGYSLLMLKAEPVQVCRHVSTRLQGVCFCSLPKGSHVAKSKVSSVCFPGGNTYFACVLINPKPLGRCFGMERYLTGNQESWVLVPNMLFMTL